MSDGARQLLEIAERAALAAGEELLRRFREPHEGLHAKSTPTDLVSEADLAAERLITALLVAERPGDALLAEEGGGELAHPGGDRLRWIVDPLDGTTNFLFGIGHWCVSIACEDAAGTVAGVVHDPLRRETFAAARAAPPTLNGEPIVGSGATELSTALVATGFAYDAAVRERQAVVVARLLPLVRDVRRFGSAALDLAWTAAGRYDAYFERALRPWDERACALLCARAGLEVIALEQRPGLPWGLLAAPPALAGELRSLVD